MNGLSMALLDWSRLFFYRKKHINSFKHTLAGCVLSQLASNLPHLSLHKMNVFPLFAAWAGSSKLPFCKNLKYHGLNHKHQPLMLDWKDLLVSSKWFGTGCDFLGSSICMVSIRSPDESIGIRGPTGPLLAVSRDGIIVN